MNYSPHPPSYYWNTQTEAPQPNHTNPSSQQPLPPNNQLIQQNNIPVDNKTINQQVPIHNHTGQTTDSQQSRKNHLSDDLPLNRQFLMEIAYSTINAIKKGHVDVSKTIGRTRLYPPETEMLVDWRRNSSRFVPQQQRIMVLPMTTLEGSQYLSSIDRTKVVSVLNFASAINPGGGFLTGARSQEESIARSSTLYTSLSSDVAKPFYDQHTKEEHSGLYSHCMIYSRSISIFRTDVGDWIKPFQVDILTSPAVNARKVRRLYGQYSASEVEAVIESVMRERMARILVLFERQHAHSIVLGSFGTGAFGNSVEFVARTWYDLLMAPGSRFSSSFENVLFAIPDQSTQQRFLMGFRPK